VWGGGGDGDENRGVRYLVSATTLLDMFQLCWQMPAFVVVWAAAISATEIAHNSDVHR
jgi:hypothetical protein